MISYLPLILTIYMGIGCIVFDRLENRLGLKKEIIDRGVESRVTALVILYLIVYNMFIWPLLLIRWARKKK